MENADLHLGVYEGQLVAEAMQVIGRTLASELDYRRVARNVAEFAYQLVNALFVYVAIPDDDENFRLVAMAGHDVDAPISLPPANEPINLEHPPLRQAVREKRPVVVADVQNSSLPWPKMEADPHWRAMVAVPLLAHNRLVGVLAAYSHRPDFFSADDVAFLMSLASQAAISIQNAQLFTELEAQRGALHQVSLRLVNAQEEERRRISRELHDELGQALTALKINLDVARRSLPPDGPEKLNQSIGEAGRLAVQTLESARNLSLELHPAILDDLGLVSALRWEIDRFEQRTGQQVQFRAELADSKFRPELEITIYRIVTEALTNVARHAQANTISIQLQVRGQQIIICIEDDGVGFDAQGWLNAPEERRSLGLVSMQERAGLLGGELEVISEPGCGTTVSAHLPLENLRIKEK
jgi:signal transduction histidine kinase